MRIKKGYPGSVGTRKYPVPASFYRLTDKDIFPAFTREPVDTMPNPFEITPEERERYQTKYAGLINHILDILFA